MPPAADDRRQKAVLRIRKGTGKLQRTTLKLGRTSVLALANPR